jgi:hypothetical protein
VGRGKLEVDSSTVYAKRIAHEIKKNIAGAHY